MVDEVQGFGTDPKRRIVPRWRTIEDSAGTAELSSDGHRISHEFGANDLLRQKRYDWSKYPSIGRAVDLIGASVALGDTNYAMDIAKSLRQDDLDASEWTRALVAKIVGPITLDGESVSPPVIDDIRMKIGTQRRRLRTEAADPMGWVELSRLYAAVGLGRKAEETIAVALHLAGNNRFVLRCASRLFVHLDQPDKAKALLEKKGRAKEDPWLLAALVAIGSLMHETVAAGAAMRMLKDGGFGPVHISELAAAVATVELEHGSTKRARKLFRTSLGEPTENSVAQASWAKRHFDIQIGMPNIRAKRQFEADAWSAYVKGDWRQCVENARSWQRDEPFSKRPSVLGSFTASVCLDDYDAGWRISEVGLMANPNDFLLLNNNAFCLINLGKVDEAKDVLGKMDRSREDKSDEIVYMATKGLYLCRTGNAVNGNAYYRRALDEADKLANVHLAALVAAHHAIEEASCNPASTKGRREDAIVRLRDAYARDPDRAFLQLERKLRRFDTGQVKEPARRDSGVV